jgi:adenosine deaminase
MNAASHAVSALASGMPKVELHVHIEGTLEPELMFELAGRNGVQLPFATVDELRAAYDFSDLQSFLDIYYLGAAALVTEDDFDLLARRYFERAHADHVRHAEIFFDPQTHTDRGIPLSTVVAGLSRAQGRAAAEHGLTSALIPCILRHLSAEAAEATLDDLLTCREAITGLGLDSSELGHPPEKFAAVFARARAEGLHVVAHAGEEGPPAYVVAALDVLQVERIDHGVRAIEDPALVQRLVDGRIPLTVCPLSNVRLRVFDRLEDHNLRALLQRGACVTINSDDPAYFGGYISENFVASARALGLDRGHLRQLGHNAIEASFASADRKRALATELDAYFGD